MSDDFDLKDDQNGRLTFDFRGYLFKVLNNWKLVLLSIATALSIAYFINLRKQNVYKLSSLISVESEQNPFFTANTSISFNWGGVTGKVGKVLTTVKTRTHNEAVVDSLEFYLEYLKEGKYRLEDIYKSAPFIIKINKSKGQVLGIPVKIKFTSPSSYELSLPEETGSFRVQSYDDKTKTLVEFPNDSPLRFNVYD
ncbi:MAG: sugar transporter, partial [Bacteroidota bacterium]